MSDSIMPNIECFKVSMPGVPKAQTYWLIESYLVRGSTLLELILYEYT